MRQSWVASLTGYATISMSHKEPRLTIPDMRVTLFQMMKVILIERKLAVSLAYDSNMQRDYVVVRTPGHG